MNNPDYDNATMLNSLLPMTDSMPLTPKEADDLVLRRFRLRMAMQMKPDLTIREAVELMAEIQRERN